MVPMGMSREIDVMHLGRDRVICAHELDGLIVDPGPTSCLDTLLEALGEQEPRALGEQEPRALLLTHIHLDHAGAAGTLVRRWPDLEVWVHERGAPHMADPSKLLASAARLYGDEMDVLWGETLPVPRERLRVLGDSGEIGGLRYAYTPGHASHHVSFLHEGSGTAFTGDVAGVRIGDGPVGAPTPRNSVHSGASTRPLWATNASRTSNDRFSPGKSG